MEVDESPTESSSSDVQMHDPDNILEERVEDREEILGFKPQKENAYNRLLPYADKLDEESQIFLKEIKENLGKAVQVCEIKPGCLLWITRLSRYIRLYGLKFSKEDHVAFVRLSFEILTMKSLDSMTVQKVCVLLTVLLKKQELLTREDLELPWRPLYDLFERFCYNSNFVFGLSHYNEGSVREHLNAVISVCRPYFPLSSTQEMLNEWRPLLCPWDVTMIKGMRMFSTFLPTDLPPAYHDQGFKLWFSELIGLWIASRNSSSVDGFAVALFSRLGRDCYGYVDFEPYLCEMFDRLILSFGLPVLFKNSSVQKESMGSRRMISAWIVSCLGGGSTCQDKLDKLFKATESYFHPSNSGKWHKRLFNFIAELTTAFVGRVHVERYKKPTWFINIPEEKKLTDDDITRFVDCVQPATEMAIFCKNESMDPCIALHELAQLRPERVIPAVVEKFYASLETVTEPHRLISCMYGMLSVCRPMVRSPMHYPEGPTHVIPLLLASLPGIDPNDYRKTVVTLQFIWSFGCLIPIVDSSSCVSEQNLNEYEETVAAATVNFEDFIVQLIDRCLVLVENSTRVNTRMEETDRMNTEEKVFEIMLENTLGKILVQCSEEIFNVALQRLKSFLDDKIMETRVSGKMAATLAKGFAQANAERTFKVFMPNLCRKIMTLTENEEVWKEENPDSELLFSILMLSEIVTGNGDALLPYREELLAVMERVLKLESLQAYSVVSRMVRYISRSLTSYYITNVGSLPEIFGKKQGPDWIPVRDWGKPSSIHNLELNWHVPNQDERKFAQELLNLVFENEVKTLKNFVSTGNVDKQLVLKSLVMIKDLVLGAGLVLPPCQEDHVRLADSVVKLTPVLLHINDSSHILTYNGENVRNFLVELVFSVIDKIFDSREDDTKSLTACASLLQNIAFHCGLGKEEYEAKRRNFINTKRNLSSGLKRKKDHLRVVLAEKALLTHYGRIAESNLSCPYVTKTFLRILDYMVKLATSHYSEVRVRAQSFLEVVQRWFSYSSSMLYPRIERLLTLDPETHHEQFKGALYVLLNMKLTQVSMNDDFDMLTKAWPALVGSKFSEKLSIIKLLERAEHDVKKYFRTVSLNIEVSNSAIDAARYLNPDVPEALIKEGRAKEIEIGKKNELAYVKLVHTLCSQLLDTQLHWRHYRLAFVMLSYLIREDIPLPAEAVTLFVNNLIHENLAIRKVAIDSTGAILKQQKISAKRVVVDPYSFCGRSPGLGEREDNSWLQYNPKTCPKTEEEWEKTRYVHKTHWGYYTWPKELLAPAPTSQQPKFARPRDELKDTEKPFFDFFSSEAAVAKLIEFLSLEDKKGKDKFNPRRYLMLKLLFRNHEDLALPVLKPHMTRLVQDKQESHQRCVAEIVAGVIRGAKYWSFPKTQALWDFLCPLLRTAFANITDETIGDWGTCMATASESRDPNKLHWMLELLMEDPIREEEGSFAETSRLYVLQGGLSQQEWRVAELNTRLMTYLRNFLTHPYQNVRDRLGSVFTNIFLQDLSLPGINPTHSPRRKDFINDVIPKLEILKEDKVAGFEDERRNEALRLFKTVCQIISGLSLRGICGATPEMFQLLPVLCANESFDIDPDLSRDCVLCLACLTQVVLGPECVEAGLSVVEAVTSCDSWKSKATCLEFFQCFVFTNMFVLLSKTEWVERVVNVVVRLLRDDRLEVREKAAKVLGGLLHCDFIPEKKVKELMANFQMYARTRIPKRRAVDVTNGIPSLLPSLILERHSGVLGLCAFVNAHPYDVPDFLPDVLMLLGDHIHDPQPIPTIVKKTLSDFRRTHYDTWHEHKEKFSDDQLVVLTDLLVSPSYYA